MPFEVVNKHTLRFVLRYHDAWYMAKWQQERGYDQAGKRRCESLWIWNCFSVCHTQAGQSGRQNNQIFTDFHIPFSKSGFDTTKFLIHTKLFRNLVNQKTIFFSPHLLCSHLTMYQELYLKTNLRVCFACSLPQRAFRLAHPLKRKEGTQNSNEPWITLLYRIQTAYKVSPLVVFVSPRGNMARHTQTLGPDRGRLRYFDWSNQQLQC